MCFSRLAGLLLVLPLFASLALGQTKISLDERMLVASKIYASIPIYFAHWQPVRDLDLDAVYKEYLQRAIAADSRWDFDHLTLEFMARLKNGHTGFDDTFLNRAGGAPLGFAAMPIEGKWTITQTYSDQLRIGDVIEQFGKVSMNDFFQEKRKYISASSERAAQAVFFYHKHLFPQQFRLLLAGGREVSIDRATQKLNFPESPLTEARWIDKPSSAYIRVRSFDNPKYEDFALNAIKEYKDARAIVIDVRGNGGGGTPSGLLRALVDRPYRDWSQGTAVSVGLFRAHARLKEIARPGELSERAAGYLDAYSEFAAPQLIAPGALIQPENPIFRGKLLVLTDFACGSACEDFVMPLKYSGRATIIGEPTRGSSGQPFLYDFGNGMSIRISARRMYFPDGSEFEGVGITPNIEVKSSIADRGDRKDVVFERAMQLISAQ